MGSASLKICNSSGALGLVKVGLTIDTVTFPPNVLMIRETASIEVVEGVPAEYLEASKTGDYPFMTGAQRVPTKLGMPLPYVLCMDNRQS